MASIHQIKASAGSGKTYTLPVRFWNYWPRLLTLPGPRSGWLPPTYRRTIWVARILAATFTNKAATEMRERLLARLKDCALHAHGKEPGWTPAHAKEAVDVLLRSYSALNIRTIDSLLHLLVRLSALDFV
jgi:ATP-dependent exoDNAse (exonuclease V) beta subunit